MIEIEYTIGNDGHVTWWHNKKMTKGNRYEMGTILKSISESLYNRYCNDYCHFHLSNKQYQKLLNEFEKRKYVTM